MVTRAMSTSMASASDPAQLKSAKEDIKELLKTKFCHPILVRRMKKLYIYFVSWA
jgi:L-ascorbate peroxidase